MAHTTTAGLLSIDYSPDKFQSRVILERDKQKTILFAFSKGQQLKEHKANVDVLLIMLEGRCAFNLEGLEQELQAGDVYKIPADAPHALQALTDFKMVLIK